MHVPIDNSHTSFEYELRFRAYYGYALCVSRVQNIIYSSGVIRVPEMCDEHCCTFNSRTKMVIYTHVQQITDNSPYNCIVRATSAEKARSLRVLD